MDNTTKPESLTNGLEHKYKSIIDKYRNFITNGLKQTTGLNTTENLSSVESAKVSSGRDEVEDTEYGTIVKYSDTSAIKPEHILPFKSESEVLRTLIESAKKIVNSIIATIKTDSTVVDSEPKTDSTVVESEPKTDSTVVGTTVVESKQTPEKTIQIGEVVIKTTIENNLKDQPTNNELPSNPYVEKLLLVKI